MNVFEDGVEILKLFLSANRVSLDEIIYSEYNAKRDMFIYRTEHRIYRLPVNAMEYMLRKEVAR